MKKSLLTIIILLPIVSFAEKGGYKKARFGMGGCGVASLFIQRNEMLPQIGASLINSYFGSTNTSAMTTGTSNCTNDPSDSAALMEQQVYVSQNYNSISKEAAQGSGEHLVAFAQVLGCDESAFMSITKANHSEIFQVSEPNATLENVKALIEKNALSCERV